MRLTLATDARPEALTEIREWTQSVCAPANGDPGNKSGVTAIVLAVHEAAARYDERIARGPRFHNDEQLRRIEFARRWPGDRLRTCRFQKILDPKAGPLVAIREFIISRKSMGGLQTDLESRVLDLSGRPVPGLFAAGESAGFGGGGMNGKRSLEGTFLGGCIFGGRIAGRVA